MTSTAAQLALKSFAEKVHAVGYDLGGLNHDPLIDLGDILDDWTVTALYDGIDPEEMLSMPVEFEKFVNAFSKLRPPPTNASNWDTLVRLCDSSQLNRLTVGLDTELIRDCYLRAGHYDQAKSIEGWDDFAAEPYPWTNDSLRDMGISNGEAYGLCGRLQESDVAGNSPAMVGLYHQIAQIAMLSLQGQSPIVRIEGEPGSGKSHRRGTSHTRR